MTNMELTRIIDLVLCSMLVMAAHTPKCGAEAELEFKMSHRATAFPNPRVAYGQNGSELRCLVKGFRGDNYRELLVIRNEQGTMQCKGAAATDADPCKWVNGSGDSDSYLAIIPSSQGTYWCECVQPCAVQIKPISAAVYLLDSKLTLTSPDGDQLNLEHLRSDNKTNFTLWCNLSSSAQPIDQPTISVKWHRNGKPLEAGSHNVISGNSLTVKFVSKQPGDLGKYSGVYMCEASGAQIADGPLWGVFQVDGPLWIKAREVSENKVEGDTVVIKCDVEGLPSGKVNWTRAEKPMPEDRATYGFEGASTATLTINNLVPEDYGYYHCGIYNASGASISDARTLVRVRSKLAPLWPFLGILAELALLAAIIVIHEKRCAKKEEDEENDDGADSNKKSSYETNNDENAVRQRKP